MKNRFWSGNPWSWVPSLYFAEGLPYIIVMTTSVIMFKKLGLSNADNALYTSWLYLPWMIKPLWSPLVDLLKTKRWWIVTMQLIIGASLACIALFLPTVDAVKYSLIFMWLIAFSSATHDIAADGFYMIALDDKKQAYFIGIRSTFYRLAMIAGQGLLVVIAGYFEKIFVNTMPENIAVAKSWSIVFYIAAFLFALLFVFHHFVLPRCEKKISDINKSDINRADINMVDIDEDDINGNDIDGHETSAVNNEVDKEINIAAINSNLVSSNSVKNLIADFFTKKFIVIAVLYILFYRFAEAQLAKIASVFMLDTVENGGLALETDVVGWIYGTIGVGALVAGGIWGGMALAKQGLKYWIIPMALAMNLPDIVYVLLSYMQMESLWFIAVCVAIEQLGYGFGFSALSYYMMLFSNGKYKTSHYAICTGLMAAGMMIPGMLSGKLQEVLGYQEFFIWIMICTIPSIISAYLVKRVLD